MQRIKYGIACPFFGGGGCSCCVCVCSCVRAFRVHHAFVWEPFPSQGEVQPADGATVLALKSLPTTYRGYFSVASSIWDPPSNPLVIWVKMMRSGWNKKSIDSPWQPTTLVLILDVAGLTAVQTGPPMALLHVEAEGGGGGGTDAVFYPEKQLVSRHLK